MMRDMGLICSPSRRKNTVHEVDGASRCYLTGQHSNPGARVAEVGNFSPLTGQSLRRAKSLMARLWSSRTLGSGRPRNPAEVIWSIVKWIEISSKAIWVNRVAQKSRVVVYPVALPASRIGQIH